VLGSSRSTVTTSGRLEEGRSKGARARNAVAGRSSLDRGAQNSPERGGGGVCWFHKHARSLAGWLFTLAGREPGGGEGRAWTFVSMKGVVDCGKGETARKGKAVA
jgi:hypothetical protein